MIVTKKQAEGLKELGYDKICEGFFTDDLDQPQRDELIGDANFNNIIEPDWFSAPYIYDAICFMDECGVQVWSTPYWVGDSIKWVLGIRTKDHTRIEDKKHFDTREQSDSAGLDFAIDYLIKQKKKKKCHKK